MFSIDQLSPILPNLNDHALQDRNRYKLIYDKIEEYAKNNGLILGGGLGITLLLEKPRTKDDFFYDLYAENDLFHANKLSNALAEAVEGSDPLIVIMRSSYGKHEISVDNRALVTITGLRGMPEGSIYDLIQPTKFKGFLLLPPKFHLIELYRTLYSPSLSGEWEHSLMKENDLFTHLKRRSKAIVGGNNTRNADLLTIMKKFIEGNKNIALIGEYALYCINKSRPGVNVITLLSQKDLEEDVKTISRLFAPRTVSFGILRVTVLSDFRLKRASIKLDGKIIMYIYNTAHYDLVPINTLRHTRSFVQIGNPFVLLRFFLIDRWIVKWIMSVGKLDVRFARARLKSITRNLLTLRSMVNIEHPAVDSLRVFQTQYIGKYENESIARKVLLQKDKKHIYFPQKYKKENGEYRIIGD